MRTFFRICSILMLVTVSLHGRAQATLPSDNHFYHLVFRAQEVDPEGKITNTRIYSTTAGGPEPNRVSIRAGSKVPIQWSAHTDPSYFDIGVKIDCSKPREEGGQFAAAVDAELNSLPAGAEASGISPLVRQNHWSSQVTVPFGKPTVIFSSDNLTDKGRTQLELTVTRIN